jgi:hypothetical protein
LAWPMVSRVFSAASSCSGRNFRPRRDLVTFVGDRAGQCSLHADAVFDNYAREVLSVQTKSRRGRLLMAPTCQSGPILS